jgi:hypothetical protein
VEAEQERAYLWGEEGLAGFSDIEQRLCLGLALWDGRDPILKERPWLQPEYEQIDTGAFDDGQYWSTEVHYAKAAPDDLLMQISVTNAGPQEATLHVYGPKAQP